MKRFAEVLILAAFLVPCAFILDHGHGYAWRGKGSDTSWETCANWLMTCSPPCPPVPCYPSNTHDTATVPYKSGG